MRMFVQDDRGVLYEVANRVCGDNCSLHQKACHVHGKERCRKMIDFINSQPYACYGFRRVKGLPA